MRKILVTGSSGSIGSKSAFILKKMDILYMVLIITKEQYFLVNTATRVGIRKDCKNY